MSGTYRALLLDLDGTLVDTAPDLAAAVNRLRRAHGLPDAEFGEIRDRCSYGGSTLTRWALALDEPDPGIIDEWLGYYGECNGEAAALFAGMEALLLHCHERDIAWGVVTNKPERFAAPLLESVLPHPPGCLLCPEHVSAAKPDPEPMLKAAQMLGCPPGECIYIGDHGRDCAAAKAAGMDFGVAGWGYLSDLDPWRDWQADCFFNAPGEIAERLAK